MNSRLLLLKSALTTENPFNSTIEVINWIKKRNQDVHVRVKKIHFDKMQNWTFDQPKSKLLHISGGFFSIEGINIKTNWGNISCWDQPIINQPEIGLLGIITKEFDGTLYFLMQAKIEPGNVNFVQLSPTLQATKSNYTKVHKGKVPKYLEYFISNKNQKREILLDQLQSEQGSRFLRKRNRNIIIRIHEDIELMDDFCWVTLGQIKELSQFDNIVNMDTRTVISGIAFDYSKILNATEYTHNTAGLSELGWKFLSSELNNGSSLHHFDHIIHWFTELKTQYDLITKPIPLHATNQWVIETDCIRHIENRYFKVIAVQVEIDNREVTSWDQPLIEPAQQGICAFIVKEICGNLHFLVQGKVEPGNFDILEMAPTVQCLTGSYTNELSRKTLPYLNYILDSKKENVILDSLQSEEGGRFYREQNRNMVLLVGEDFPIDTPDNYIWMTLNQLKMFIKFNNYLNIQARSLISLISFN
jgi:oxidase EvaA